MRVGLMTREYPPAVYGGAGVHVEYLSLELAKLESRLKCTGWGTQRSDEGNLHVIGDEPPAGSDRGNGCQVQDCGGCAGAESFADERGGGNRHIVHTHTWYASMAGFLAKKLYKIPFVLPRRIALNRCGRGRQEQLGSGYAMSSWMERTAILDADAINSVTHGTKADILKAYPDVDPAKVHVIYNGIDLKQYQKSRQRQTR